MISQQDSEPEEEMIRRLQNDAYLNFEGSFVTSRTNSPRATTNEFTDDRDEDLFVTPSPPRSQADDNDTRSRPRGRNNQSSSRPTGISNGRHYKHFGNSRVINKHIERLQALTQQKSWARFRPRITTHVFGGNVSSNLSHLFSTPRKLR